MLRTIAILSACAGLCACSVWPVNQDPAGMDYRRSANQIIEALQRYHQAKGTFPTQLSALVPAYLPDLPDAPPIHYHPVDGSLEYRYIPTWPQLRPVWCNSVGNTTNWKCAEHLI